MPILEKSSRLGRPRKREYLQTADKSIRPLSARSWAKKLTSSKEWKTLRLPTKSDRKVKAIGIRVRESVRRSHGGLGPERWLIIEENEHEQRYYLSNFPENTSLEKMIQVYHERFAIEQGYQQLKEEFGMDHFEGRSWMGFHHHVTLSFMAYCFLQTLRMSKKKDHSHNPSASQTMDRRSIDCSPMPTVSLLDHKRPFGVFQAGLACT